MRFAKKDILDMESLSVEEIQAVLAHVLLLRPDI